MTSITPLPEDEAARLAALKDMLILDTAEEPVFDAIAALAAAICETPIALISLVDRHRQWFKARVGLDVRETPREFAFCAHAILNSEIMEVADAASDPRFRDNPLVVGDPNIRFYAGRPLLSSHGHALGTLCVIDRVPRALSSVQHAALESLSKVVLAVFESHREIRQFSAALQHSEARIRAIADNVPALIAYIDSEQRYRFCNAQISRTFGTTPQSLIGRTMREVRGESLYAELRPHIEAALRGEVIGFDGQSQVDGRVYWFHSDYIPDREADGQVRGFYALTFDVTAQKTAEQLAAASEHRMRLIADHVPAAVCYIDEQRCYRFNNAAYARWFGRPIDEITGRTVREIQGEEVYRLVEPNLERAFAGEQSTFEITIDRLGEARHLRVSYVPEREEGGRVTGVYALIQDSTALINAQKNLLKTSQHDSLTGLVNRSRLDEILAEAAARSRRHGLGVALLYLDIDHFKQINDSHGHAAGDNVLREFARRIQSCARGTDTVARLGGDEFVIALEDLHDSDGAVTVASKIREAMRVPVDLEGASIDVGASIGIAFARTGHFEPEMLLKRADRALYQAKAGGRGDFRLAPDDAEG